MKRAINAFEDRDSFFDDFAFVIRFKLSFTIANNVDFAFDVFVVLSSASNNDEVVVLLDILIKIFEKSSFEFVLDAIY